METNIEGLKITYSVRRSDEASRPRIDHKKGEFTVVIPEGQDQDPEELIHRKKDWVSKRRKEFLKFQRKIPERNLEEGEALSILGDEKQITIERRRSNKVGEDIFLAKHLVERTSVKDQLEKALKNEARSVIEEKIRKYSESISGEYDKIYIRDQETRWGSCSDKDNLSFNWRLILAPEHVLEYVVVHELVHIEQKNHSEKFWSRVRELYPQYRESNKWLSEKSSQLVFDKLKTGSN